jgi:hypothetical protein
MSQESLRYAPYRRGKVFLKMNADGKPSYADEASYRERYRNEPGQINPSTHMGGFLANLAENGPANWLEIGTWNGLGSTLCILDGFLKRPSHLPPGRLITYEVDPMMAGIAKENLSFHPMLEAVEFVEGRLGVSEHPPLQPPTFEELAEADQQTIHCFMHFDREVSLYRTSAVVTPPFQPEVVLLDGGEYTGHLDWFALDKTRLQVLILDDINSTKNHQLHVELQADSEHWVEVQYFPYDRNGWAAFARRKA